MPTPADAPLRKVTLNLFEADCAWLEETIGHGWSEYVRTVVHVDCQRKQRQLSPRTLGDLAP